MAGNVHKDEVNAVKIPSIATQEDRGLSRCEKPIRVLATLTSTERHKNDLTGIALIADTLTVELEDESGTVTSAPGTSVSFPYQSNAVGFVIDWRQVTRNGGTEIATGCYKVKLSGTISGIAFTYYYAAFELDVWSMLLAKNTVQVFSVLNDLVRKDAINYRESGFCNTVRFKGSFGFMQPNYQTTNLTYSDRTRKKVNNEALRTYELRTSYLVGCLTEMIDEQHLLAANQIYITEHNPLAHKQYIEFPVILDEDTSPSLEYPPGIYAKLTAVFKDKVAVHQSKYDGNIAANENVSFDLPNALVCTGDTANISVNSTPEGTTDSGDVDILLSDSGGTVTPTSVTITGSDVNITVPDSVSPVGATLPKTAQTTVYATDDDGDLQAGRLTDSFTLDVNNPFGNTNRYTDELGTQTYANDIVIDWMTYDTVAGTVLGYYRVTGGVDTWNNAVANAAATSVGAFTTGWRLTNMNELHNLAKIGSAAASGQGRAFNWSPINQGNLNTRYWTSSTLDNYTNQPYYFSNFFGGGGIVASQTYNWLACRTFTVTGTTLT